MTSSVFTTVAVVAALALAGCIALPEDPNDLPPRDPATGGSMTASETTTEKSELCTQDLGLAAGDRFCAERLVTVTGTVSGFDRLDVDLETFNGAVKIGPSSGDAWGFVATLRARGATASEAMAKVEDIAFAWAHEGAGGHFVEVVAEHDGDTEGRSVAIELTMPRALAMRLSATTSNGEIHVEDARTDGLALTTSNGKVTARADVTQVAIVSSNGALDAQLRPIGDGRWSLVTSNGAIALEVPEGGSYGYSMDGTTSNGEVDYALRDGAKGDCPQGSQYYTPPCNHRTFETRSFRAREHAAYVSMITSNGKISVAPA